MSRRTPRTPPRFGSYVLSLPLARRTPAPEVRLNDLFSDLLRLIARLLDPLDRTSLRATCRATWEADRHFRLPRPLQAYLETFPWWLPQERETIATCLRWRAHRHLFAPWIGLCDTPVFAWLDRERLVPAISEGRLIFRARVYRGRGEPARRYELELRNSSVRFREGDDKDGDEVCWKSPGESAGDCILRGLSVLAPGLLAYLKEPLVLPGRRLCKGRRSDDCFYVMKGL
jgi:hypothetical protein